MRLEQLEYLIEIAKQNSMSTASEQLHLAPQTLSISMKNLEKKVSFYNLKWDFLSLNAPQRELL